MTVAETILQPGSTLHSTAWQPLWNVSHASTCTSDRVSWVNKLARRAASRSLAGKASDDTIRRDCETVARSILADCDRFPDPATLRTLSAKWCHLFDTAITGVDATRSTDPITRELRTLISRIWKYIIIGSNHDAINSADETVERLFIDVDHAIRKTYHLEPAYGFTLRRSFFGVATSAVELSGFNPYGRLADGIGNTCRQ